MSLINEVRDYYQLRGLTFPSFDNAMKFVQTELAEVYELDLAKTGGWVRNNPQNKPTFSSEKLAEELGDSIMMLIVAGIAEGVDPIAALRAKMKRKLDQKKVEMVTQMEMLSEEDVNRLLSDTGVTPSGWLRGKSGELIDARILGDEYGNNSKV